MGQVGTNVAPPGPCGLLLVARPIGLARPISAQEFPARSDKQNCRPGPGHDNPARADFCSGAGSGRAEKSMGRAGPRPLRAGADRRNWIFVPLCVVDIS